MRQEILEHCSEIFAELTSQMKKSQETKKIIDGEAKRIFYENGYQDTSMRQIATAAKIPVSVLYYYYQSKEDIYTRLFTEEITNLFIQMFLKVDVWSPRPVAEIIADLIEIRTPEQLSAYELFLHKTAYRHWLGIGESKMLGSEIQRVLTEQYEGYHMMISQVKVDGYFLKPVAIRLIYQFIIYKIIETIFSVSKFDRKQVVEELTYLIGSGCTKEV